MPNSYFQFKQFTVHQDKAAMKVCTDACLFGTWVAGNIKDRKNVLDIGTGTGLLSLMYAQKNPVSLIDALEIDAGAAEQAQDNFKISPWNSRITLHSSSIQAFSTDKKYDLILSNPPFFENDLRSPGAGKNKAMHDASLTLKELADHIIRLLSPEGIAALLLPHHRVPYFITLMNSLDLQLVSHLLVKQTPAHNYFRSILCFSAKAAEKVKEDELIIKDSTNNYSEKFVALLKDYYLYF